MLLKAKEIMREFEFFFKKFVEEWVKPLILTTSSFYHKP